MPGYTELLREALQRGEPLDVCLAALRQEGGSIIDAVKAVREVKGLSLAESKRLVDESHAFGDSRDSFPPESRGRSVHEISAASGRSENLTRRVLGFTLRDVMWLAVVIVIGLAWLTALQRAAMFEARTQGLERQLKSFKKASEPGVP